MNVCPVNTNCTEQPHVQPWCLLPSPYHSNHLQYCCFGLWSPPVQLLFVMICLFTPGNTCMGEVCKIKTSFDLPLSWNLIGHRSCNWLAIKRWALCYTVISRTSVLFRNLRHFVNKKTLSSCKILNKSNCLVTKLIIVLSSLVTEVNYLLINFWLTLPAPTLGIQLPQAACGA